MNQYRLEDICKVKSSKRIYVRDYVDKGIPFLRGKEITEMSKNKSISENIYISEERFSEIDSKFGSPQIGDILMTAVGTLGNVWMVNKTPIYFKDGNLIWFTDFKKEVVNPNYLKVLFESSWFQDILINKGTIGSVQSAFTIEKVSRICIPLPELKVQDNIVLQLSKLTALRTINFKLISDLEEYSKLLFYKWFVDFNFPDKNGNPYRKLEEKCLSLKGRLFRRGGV